MKVEFGSYGTHRINEFGIYNIYDNVYVKCDPYIWIAAMTGDSNNYGKMNKFEVIYAHPYMYIEKGKKRIKIEKKDLKIFDKYGAISHVYCSKCLYLSDKLKGNCIPNQPLCIGRVWRIIMNIHRNNTLLF